MPEPITPPTQQPSAQQISDQWSGLAPFVTAAFKMSAANDSKNKAMWSSVNGIGKLSPPGATSKTPIGVGANAGMGQGPMVMPQQIQADTIPNVLQEGVNGPMSMPNMPKTPLTQDTGAVPSQINHFITGIPNTFGARSVGV